MSSLFELREAIEDLSEKLFNFQSEHEDATDELDDLREKVKKLEYKLKAVGVVCRNYEGIGYRRIAEIVGNPYPKYPRF